MTAAKAELAACFEESFGDVADVGDVYRSAAEVEKKVATMYKIYVGHYTRVWIGLGKKVQHRSCQVAAYAPHCTARSPRGWG